MSYAHVHRPTSAQAHNAHTQHCRIHVPPCAPFSYFVGCRNTRTRKKTEFFIAFKPLKTGRKNCDKSLLMHTAYTHTCSEPFWQPTHKQTNVTNGTVIFNSFIRIPLLLPSTPSRATHLCLLPSIRVHLCIYAPPPPPHHRVVPPAYSHLYPPHITEPGN